jgi:hypothetical protein
MMSEQSTAFGELLEALSMLATALGKSANLQTMGSRSIEPPDLPVTVFLRDQRAQPILKLVHFRNAEQAAKGSGAHLVYVGRRFPAHTALNWRNKGQSFIDLAGSVFVEVPGLLVDKKVPRRPVSTGSRSKAVDPFADRASTISRHLLKHPPRQSWGVRQLGAITQVSLGTASKIIRELEERGLVVVTRHGRSADVSVERPYLLFKAWAAAYDWKRNVSLTVSAPVGDRMAFIKSLPRRLAPIDTQWALTLQAGAALVAPHAEWNRTHIYINTSPAISLESVAADMNWTPDAEGRVTLMRPYYRESIWIDVQRRIGIPVVDNLQLALDLWNYPVRGREQAEHLLKRQLNWILKDRG